MLFRVKIVTFGVHSIKKSILICGLCGLNLGHPRGSRSNSVLLILCTEFRPWTTRPYILVEYKYSPFLSFVSSRKMCAICFWKRKNLPSPSCSPPRILTPIEDITDTESSDVTDEEDMDLSQESSVVKSPQKLQGKK